MRQRFVLVILLVGCGGGPGGGGDDTPDGAAACPTSGRYLELTAGRSWTYKVTDTMTHTVGNKTQTVGGLEAVAAHPGIMAFKLTTTKPGGQTDSWQQDTGTEIRRHAENDNAGSTVTTEQYDPYRIRIDETPAHTASGATWTTSYTEIVTAMGNTTTTAKDEIWSVVAVDERVDVPGGSFCALHVHRTSMIAGQLGSTKDFWFTRGVGKVKETGDGQTEELTAYTQ